MPRLGREFETLVSLLEKELGPQGVIVTSPDYIRGKMSGSNREIDISLRHQIGSSCVLLVIECRKRADSQDVSWIEQVASKIKDIGADKAVVVSSNGFTSGAKNFATANNIEVRTLEEVDVKEFGNWLGTNNMVITDYRVEFREINFDLPEDAPSEIKFDKNELRKVIEVKTPFFNIKGSDKKENFWSLWKRCDRERLYNGIIPNGAKIIRTVYIEIDPDLGIFQIPHLTGYVDIQGLKIVAELWIEESESSFKYRQYKNDDSILTEIAECKVTIENEEKIVSLHRIPKGELAEFSLSLRESDK